MRTSFGRKWPVIAILAAVALCSGCTASSGAKSKAKPTPTQTLTTTATVEPVTFALATAGDMLTHEPVMDSAKVAGGYDFSPQFAPTKPYVANADLAICQMEVPIAPEGQTVSGYPMFAAPPELARDIAKAGWDGCTTSSNHSLDRRMAGIVRTLDMLSQNHLGFAGTGRTQAEAESPQIYELKRNGRTIKVAQIAQTYGTNGIPLPAEAPWAVQMLDAPAAIARAQAARKAGAQVVIYALQQGTEYRADENEEQRQFATELANSKQFDLIFGNHPHVPEPIKKLPGGPDGQGMWVIYSHGNFISNQGPGATPDASGSGILVTTTFTVPATGPAHVDKITWTGVVVDRSGGHVVYPFDAELENGQRPAKMTLSKGYLDHQLGLIREVMGDVPQMRTPLPENKGAFPVALPH